MVKPVESKFVGQTLEDRLAHKFDDLQIAREEHQSELFDEIAKSIEVLMKGVPEAYKELMREKGELDKDLDEEVISIQQEAGGARDEIHRQAIYNTRGFKAMWDYREVYEEIIIEIMQKYKLIAMRNLIKSALESPEQYQQQQMGVPEMQRQLQSVPPPLGFVPPQQQVPVPPPPSEDVKKKKPRLSFMKRGQNQPKDFNL